MQTIEIDIGRSKRLTKEDLPSPPNWTADSLSDFIEAAHQNRFATFVHKKEWFARLSSLDSCFLRIATDWLNPKNLITPTLFLRCHAAYRAACEHALAGQIAEVFPEIRTALEYAGYACHIHTNRGLDEVWLRRHDDAVAMKIVKQEFRISNVRATIMRLNQHTAKIFDELYQRTIDFGAHPNERAVTSSMIIKDHDDRKELQQIYLHGDGPILDHGLKTTAQAGVCALEIFQEVFAARFEILGVRAEILQLRQGL
jgi:hypothetical protein